MRRDAPEKYFTYVNARRVSTRLNDAISRNGALAYSPITSEELQAAKELCDIYVDELAKLISSLPMSSATELRAYLDDAITALDLE